MTRIDFYQIESDEPALTFTCRLIEKAWRGQHRVFVQTRDTTERDRLDELLWSLREDRFIPHEIDPARPAPIHIGCDENPGDHHDVLVNLSGTIPDFFSRFTRVAEVVPLAEAEREHARINYRFYRDRGYPLKYHSIGA